MACSGQEALGTEALRHRQILPSKRKEPVKTNQPAKKMLVVLTIVVNNLQTIEARFAKLIHKMTAWSFKVIEQPLNFLVSPANFKNRLLLFFFLARSTNTFFSVP